MKYPIIFTDLDGTLLDYSTYSFEAALPALKSLKEKNIPLVICSSKTRKEIEYYREKFGNRHPFISENGGGIFIPKEYFGSVFKIPANGLRGQSSESEAYEENDYYIIRLGAKYPDLRRVIGELRHEHFSISGFGDMTVEEIAKLAYMTIDEASRAKKRDFDEPFIFEGEEEEKQKLFDAIKSKGFNFNVGRFFHILGDSDKGKAVSILIDLYKERFDDILTFAVGDSPNDIPMLERVDHPIIVQKPDGSHDSRINILNLVRAEGVGPAGWNKVISKLIETIHRP